MKTIIIAEAGVNHNGSLETAKKLIKAASDCGADYIKFQTYITGNLVSKKAGIADYQKKNLGKAKSQYDMLREYELSEHDHRELIKCCRRNNISFFSTAFDLASIDMLASLKIPMWKIPSGEITNLPYLQKIGAMNKPVLLSTGMSTLGEIEEAIGVLEASGTKRDKITVLHCTTEYPAPFDEVNLNSMVTIANSFKVKVGYSDHTEGIVIPLAAVALGASVIEKHFTLDRKMKGPDHKASLEPDEFKEMVNSIRKLELAFGDGIKRPALSELMNRNITRKSLVAAKDIARGQVFTIHNITTKRPGNGLSPMLLNKILGLHANRNYKADDIIEL